jgi:predicted transcriptional regulator
VIALDILSVYRFPDSFSIGLTLGDEQLLLAAYDDEKQLQALVEATETRLHAWASALFERYKEQSEKMTKG